MKNLISVFALTARSTLYKCMGIIAAAAALEAGLFAYHLQKLGGVSRLESIFNNQFSYRIIICAAAIALFWILATVFRGKGQNKPGYTLVRLSTSEKTLIAATALYDLCLLLFAVAVQVLLFWIFCKAYAAQIESSDAVYMTYLAFTRSDLISAFLPMHNAGRLLNDLIILVSLGLSAAYSGVGRSFAPVAVTLIPLAMQLLGGGQPVMILQFIVSIVILIILLVMMRNLDPMLERPEEFTGGEHHA